MLSKRISLISKSALLFSLLLGGFRSWPLEARELVSSDRFLFRVIDQTISFQDFQYQLRNMKALKCLFPDAMVMQYFGSDFIKNLETFLKNFPTEDKAARTYMHQHEELLLSTRYFFKMIRYALDQKALISAELAQLIKQSTKENKCDTAVLYGETLKTNFISLMQVELYLRARYGGQLKGNSRNFNLVKPSIDLFVESLDKQFTHEYFW